MASLEARVANVMAPSESHLSLKAIPGLSAVCCALHCEGHQQGRGGRGRTCQPSRCALNISEACWEHEFTCSQQKAEEPVVDPDKDH